MQVENVNQLTGEQLSEVLSLVEAATRVDKVSPLSEHVLLAARDDPSASGAASNNTASTTTTTTSSLSTISSTSSSPSATSTSRPHFLAYEGTHLAGYAHLERDEGGEDATAEVVVDPGYRRHGMATMLIRALDKALEPDAVSLQQESVTLRLWAHGNLDGARALAFRDGYSTVRELWQMRLSLRSEDAPVSARGSLPGIELPAASGRRPDTVSLPVVGLPEGFRSRHFVVGQDEDAWLRVNARAFVDHAEQGRMTRHDLDRRIAEPWFDATGFILIEDTRGAEPVLAASHWTKVVPGADPQVSPTEGEVYVVGVDPAYQGLGLGRAVTVLGLAHLREKGLTQAMLYVEADNRAAIATYSRLGFARCAVDIMYSRTVQSPV